jgi:methyl-accepting chemotaxis protein
MLLLLESSLTEERTWPILGMGVLALAYILLRPMLKRKDPLARPPAQGSMAQERAVERQMQSLLVDLNEMARQIGAQLDTRAAKLEALLHEADEKIAQLRGLGASSHSTTSQSTMAQPQAATAETAASAPASIASSLHELDPRHAEVYALADEGRPPREIAAQLNRPSGEIELILALRTRG